MKTFLLRALTFTAAIIWFSTCSASVITVTNTASGGDGSLRNAISTASDGDTINFSVTGIIAFDGVLTWDKSLTILGPGATNLILDGGNSTGLFQITHSSTHISGLTFQHASANFGACIDLSNAAVADTTTIENCVFRNNRVTSQGAAVCAVYPRYLVMRNCWVDSCTSTAMAAGIFARNGATLENCTFSNCSSASYAGAAYVEGSNSSVTNCTFYHNSSGTNGSAVYYAGDYGTMRMVNNTFAANRGDNVFYLSEVTYNGGSSAELYNNIFSNPARSFDVEFGGMAAIAAMGGNVIADSSLNQWIASTDLSGIDALPALLDVFANNGGVIPTIALTCMSSAINHGLDAFGPVTDQRGVVRHLNDAGAFEYQTPVYYQTITICRGGNLTLAGHVYSVEGMYTDTVSVADACDSIITTKILVNAIDTAVKVVGGTLEAKYELDKTFQWIDCSTGAAIDGATGQTFTPTQSGSYAVIETISSCPQTSACYTIMLSGITDNNASTGFSIYPNPATNFVTVQFDNNLQNAGIRLVDAFGALVFEQNGIVGNKTGIDLTPYAQGIYFVEITANSHSMRNRLIKN